MVDNKVIAPVSSFNFKSGDISGTAAKLTEEKNGQGGEYFAQEMEEQEEQKETNYQDRSAQLRASLDTLASVNAGSLMVAKYKKEKERLKELQDKIKKKSQEEKELSQEEDEALYDE